MTVNLIYKLSGMQVDSSRHTRHFRVVAAESTPTATPTPISGTYKVGQLKYTVKNNKATVKAPVNKKATKLTIPATITVKSKKIKVTGIAANALSNMSKLTTLTIGSNISSIGAKAIYNCPKLKIMTVKTKSLKTSIIGANAFEKGYKKATVKCPSGKAETYKIIFVKKGMNKKSVFE